MKYDTPPLMERPSKSNSSRPRLSPKIKSACVGLFTSVVAGAGMASAQTTSTINFDTAGNWTQGSAAFGSYSNHGYTEASWSFTSASTIRNTTAAQDSVAGALGTYSWRLRDNATGLLQGTFNSAGTIAGFGFDVRRWDATPDTAYIVEYSTNSGSTFVSTGITINSSYLDNSSNWKTLTYTLPAPVAVTSGQFVVKVYATVVGERIMIDNFQWTTGTAGPDTTPPAIVSRTPGIGATNIPVNSPISMTFDEPVALGSGSIQLFKEAGASDVPVAIGPVSVNAATVSFSPSAALEFGQTYYVLVPSTAITDTATPTPNAFPGILSETDWTFTTVPPDLTGPAVTTLSPSDNASDVPNAANPTIVFDEQIQAGTGTINLRKTVGDALVQSFDVTTASVTIFNNTLTINPSQLLEPGTSYYVEVPAGAVLDTSPNSNPCAAIAGPGGWNFATKALPSVVISQYYEGTGTNDRYVELKNLTAAPLTLTGYRLTVWSNTAPSDNEGWKTGTGTTDREVLLDSVTLPPSGFILIANSAAVAPAYAANSANFKGTSTDEATFFSGDDSVVLYQGASNALANVIDAVSVVSTEATDTSFYRVTDVPAFNFESGSSIIDELGQAWQQISTATVDAATPTDPFYLKAETVANPPVLATFNLGNSAANAATPRVTLDYTRTGGVPTEYMVSESSDFSGASWTSLPGGSPLFSLSSGTGTKTVYFKLRNTDGESGVISDTINRIAYSNPGNLLFTQYYEGTSNNKYVEITNVGTTAINLSTWRLVRWGNAEAENWKVTGFATGGSSAVMTLSGSLAAGATAVLANNSATSPVSAASAFFANSNINHTGNDSFALYEGSVAPENLRDALSFTSANEGPDTSFVRISLDSGFNFDSGSSVLSVGTVWEQVTTTSVNSASSGQNIHLGSFSLLAGYTGWASTNAGGQTADLDFDNDGVPNGVEFFMNAAAGFTANPGLTGGTVTWPNGGNLLPGDYGTKFKVQTSTNLSSWNDVASDAPGLTNTAGSLSYTPTAPAPFFVRLLVTP